MSINKPRGIVLHHSVFTDGYASDSIAVANYHIKVRHWRYPGYNGMIEKVGDEMVYVPMRPLWEPGAHCPGMNYESIGLCCMGNFEADTMSDEMFSKLVEVTKAYMMIYDFGPESIWRHRDVALPGHGTLCPGKNFPYNELISEVSK
jgi:N-acetylmuramoyl-L-alanine amidase